MKKQFRIGNSNTFLVSKNNDQSELTFAIEEIDDILDERKLRICDHFHNKQEILNHLIRGNLTSCPDCKGDTFNISSSSIFIDAKVNEKDLEVLYLYGRDYEKDEDKFNEIHTRMLDLLNKNQIVGDSDYNVILDSFSRFKNLDDENFILFLAKDNIIYGYYNCSIMMGSLNHLQARDGFFYIPLIYRGQGYCKILSKTVFSTQKNIIGVKKIYVVNIMKWTGIFCYFSGALDNGLIISLWDNNTQISKPKFERTQSGLTEIQNTFSKFVEMTKSLPMISEEEYNKLTNDVINHLENDFHIKDDKDKKEFLNALKQKKPNEILDMFNELAPKKILLMPK